MKGLKLNNLMEIYFVVLGSGKYSELWYWRGL